MTYGNYSVVLDPGQVPEIRGVTRSASFQQFYFKFGVIISYYGCRFPDAHRSASKIPTVIYCDQTGKVRAVGAEAMKKDICEVGEDEKWVKAEW